MPEKPQTLGLPGFRGFPFLRFPEKLGKSDAEGGALALSGTVSGTVRLDDGAILKVDPTSALTFATGSTLVLPEAGVAVIDCSAVELTDSSASQAILSGVALTDAQLAQLALRGKPWMKLVVEDGALVLRLEKHPPKILFR